MHKILTPVDGSVHSVKALKIASDLALKYNGRVFILHVLLRGKDAKGLLALNVSSLFDDRLREILKKAEAANLGPAPDELLDKVGQIILEQSAERAQHYGIEFELLPLLKGTPADEIINTQQKIEAGTIVMGARGVSYAEDTTFGSVSQDVFNRADCTCISVK